MAVLSTQIIAKRVQTNYYRRHLHVFTLKLLFFQQSILTTDFQPGYQTIRSTDSLRETMSAMAPYNFSECPKG